MAALPAGIVTFLFTDIEGSTRLWERDRAAMTRAARRHDAILDAAITNHHGVLFKHVGDAVQAAFPTPLKAVSAAIEAQRALAAEPWPETGPIRARMAIHSGEATPDSRGRLSPGAKSQSSRPPHGIRARRASASVARHSASCQQSPS
jgi:class 3 adenylate cyclase